VLAKVSLVTSVKLKEAYTDMFSFFKKKGNTSSIAPEAPPSEDRLEVSTNQTQTGQEKQPVDLETPQSSALEEVMYDGFKDEQEQGKLRQQFTRVIDWLFYSEDEYGQKLLSQGKIQRFALITVGVPALALTLIGAGLQALPKSNPTAKPPITINANGNSTAPTDQTLPTNAPNLNDPAQAASTSPQEPTIRPTEQLAQNSQDNNLLVGPDGQTTNSQTTPSADPFAELPTQSPSNPQAGSTEPTDATQPSPYSGSQSPQTLSSSVASAPVSSTSQVPSENFASLGSDTAQTPRSGVQSSSPTTPTVADKPLPSRATAVASSRPERDTIAPTPRNEISPSQGSNVGTSTTPPPTDAQNPQGNLANQTNQTQPVGTQGNQNVSGNLANGVRVANPVPVTSARLPITASASQQSAIRVAGSTVVPATAGTTNSASAAPTRVVSSSPSTITRTSNSPSTPVTPLNATTTGQNGQASNTASQQNAAAANGRTLQSATLNRQSTAQNGQPASAVTINGQSTTNPSRTATNSSTSPVSTLAPKPPLVASSQQVSQNTLNQPRVRVDGTTAQQPNNRTTSSNSQPAPQVASTGTNPQPTPNNGAPTTAVPNSNANVARPIAPNVATPTTATASTNPANRTATLNTTTKPNTARLTPTPVSAQSPNRLNGAITATRVRITNEPGSTAAGQAPTRTTATPSPVQPPAPSAAVSPTTTAQATGQAIQSQSAPSSNQTVQAQAITAVTKPNPGDIVEALMATGAVVSELQQGPTAVAVKSADGAVWIGEAAMTVTGRMAIEFRQFIFKGVIAPVKAIALAPDGLQGLNCIVSEEVPSLAADLVRSALAGVASYVDGLGSAKSVTFGPNGQPVQAQAAPTLLDQVLGNVGRLFALQPNTRAVVRVGKVARDTPLLIFVLP
jgi:hypothetical protein